MFKSVFGDIDGKWGKINLNKEAKRFPEINFSDPEECDKWIQNLHKLKKIQYSYGGFLEDRSFIWKNHYNVKKNIFIHEGVDFNVPKKTDVFLFEDGEVIEIINESDLHGGWGTAVVFKIFKIKKYVIYAHLNKKICVKLDGKYKKGEKVGTIGEPHENGNYFPHLHLQVMDEKFAENHKCFQDVEGYSSKESKMLKHLYDPIKFVK